MYDLTNYISYQPEFQLTLKKTVIVYAEYQLIAMLVSTHLIENSATHPVCTNIVSYVGVYIYPFKHYLTPCSKLHSCLTILTSHNGNSSVSTIRLNYLGAFLPARTLLCDLLFICFVFELHYQTRKQSSY